MKNETNKRLVFVCRQLIPGGIRSSFLSLINSIYLKYDISLVVLSEETSKDDIIYLNKRGVRLINAGLPPHLLYTSGEYYRKSFSLSKLFLKALVKLGCVCLSERRIVNLTMKKLSSRLSEESFDVAISFTNDIWIDGWCMPGCNYLVSTLNAKQKIGWIHAAVDYLGLTRDILKTSYKNYQKVVCVSDACRKELIDTCPDLSGKVYTCHNLVDKERLNALGREDIKEIHQRNVDFRIVTVARIELCSKRQDRIINIAKMLKDEGIKFAWYLVGGGMDFERVSLEIKREGLEEQLIMTGMLDNPYPYIINSDLFVLTSDTESYGIVLREAIMCGTPVITTNFPAAVEVVEDNVNGCIVPMNENDIFKKIYYLISNKVEIERLSKNCQSTTWKESEAFEFMIGA